MKKDGEKLGLHVPRLDCLLECDEDEKAFEKSGGYGAGDQDRPIAE